MTTTQQKQLDYLHEREQAEARYGMGTMVVYECKCHTCNESQRANVASSATDFVFIHEGHKTWITRLGPERITVQPRRTMPRRW